MRARRHTERLNRIASFAAWAWGSVNDLKIRSTANPVLELGLQFKLRRRAELAGGLGELKALALRLGMVQGLMKPRFDSPQLLLFAADHGLAVEGVVLDQALSTATAVARVLDRRVPLPVFADLHGLHLTVVDCGIAEALPAALAAHPRLLHRKAAHGSRSSRLSPAMSLAQAHAGVQNGMRLVRELPGNALLCAGLGAGGLESAALMIARLTHTDVRDLVDMGPGMSDERLSRLMVVLHTALDRHQQAQAPMDILAALGGHDIAAMAGAILVAAGQRRLIVLDGLPACAAYLLARSFAPEVRDFAVCTHSHPHAGLQRARALMQAPPMLELGLNCMDGTGATLAWPLILSAAALLTEVVEDEWSPSAEPHPGAMARGERAETPDAPVTRTVA